MPAVYLKLRSGHIPVEILIPGYCQWPEAWLWLWPRSSRAPIKTGDHISPDASGSFFGQPRPDQRCTDRRSRLTPFVGECNQGMR